MSQYFSKPYERSGGNVNVELDLSNYAVNVDQEALNHLHWHQKQT